MEGFNNKTEKKEISQPEVFIDFDPHEKMQKFIEAEDESGNIFIISSPDPNHKDILESFNRSNKLNLKCLGGGYLFKSETEDGEKKLKVFGRSRDFGYFNQDRVISSLKQKLPEFEIFFDPYS